MSDDITGLCEDHSFESAEEVCRRCGGEFCELCLVYPFGAAKPMCKECAMVAGGVRSHSSRLEMKGREVKRKIKAFEQRRRRTAEAATAVNAVEVSDPILTDPLAPTEDDLQRVSVPAPAPVEPEVEPTEEPPPPPPPPPPPATAPTGDAGVAPPIDWSQPFG